MPHEFPKDIHDRLQERLSAGAYQTEDDVIRDAMDALDQIELDKFTRWRDRNQLSAEQSEQGLSRSLDDQRVLARLRARLAKEGIVD